MNGGLPKGMHRETDIERATRLTMQAHISEHNRRVRLEARPDAAQRMAAAQAKRDRRKAKRAIPIIFTPWRYL